MSTDATGRLIRVGDVCGYSHRRGSVTYQDIVIIRAIELRGIRGDKVVALPLEDGGHKNILVATKPIKVSANLIITSLTEKELLSLMRIEHGRREPRKYKPRKKLEAGHEKK